MRFWEAMKALEEGKKVRCKDWDEIIPSDPKPEKPGVCTVSINWLKMIRTEWELYEEPQQLLTFAQRE